MMPSKLALTSLSDFNDDPRKTLLLGEWCKNSTSCDIFQVHPYPLREKSEWVKAFKLAEKTYNFTLSTFAKRLNQYHNEKLKQEYWEHVIGWFLHCFIDSVVEKYIVLSSARSNWPEIVAIGLDPNQFSRPKDTRSFSECIRFTEEANLQIFTQIAELMGISIEYRSLTDSLPFEPHTSTNEDNSSKSILWKLRNRFQTDLPDADICFYKTVMRRRTLSLLTLLTGFNSSDIRDFAELSGSCQIDIQARATLSNTSSESELENIVLKLLAHNLPTCFFEQWRGQVDKARAWVSSRRPSTIVTGLGGLWSSQYAVWSAECKRYGVNIIGLQHGGTYGERERSSSECHERRISDFYVTWGWQENEKTIPLPAARLAGLPRYSRNEKGSILWIGTSDSRYVYQLGPRPVGSQFLDYFKEQLLFADSLEQVVVKEMLFRPYPVDFGWANQPGVSQELSVNLDDLSKSYWERLRECKLVIVDHPGSTTFLEALTIGRPSICFGSPDVFDIRPEAKPYYDALSDVGVFHTDAKSAAQTLNNIASDVLSWWDEPDRQRAVDKFRRNFADDTGFLRKWRRFLLDTRKVAGTIV